MGECLAVEDSSQARQWVVNHPWRLMPIMPFIACVCNTCVTVLQYFSCCSNMSYQTTITPIVWCVLICYWKNLLHYTTVHDNAIIFNFPCGVYAHVHGWQTEKMSTSLLQYISGFCFVILHTVVVSVPKGVQHVGTTNIPGRIFFWTKSSLTALALSFFSSSVWVHREKLKTVLYNT